MKKLHILTVKSFLGPFILTFFIVVFVLLMQFLWKYIDDLVGKGLEISVISELLIYTSASLVPMALPLAVLLSSIMTFGNMAEYNELLALKAAGISLQKIMAPVMVVSIFITLAAFAFNNNVLPYSNLKMRSLLYDIQRQNPDLQIKAGVFDNSIDGYSIRIEEKDARTNLLKNIRIYDHTDRMGNIIVTTADSGYMRMTEDESILLMTLYSGHSYEEMQKKKTGKSREKTYPHRRDVFDKQEILIELTDFGLKRTDENLFKSSYQMMNLSQLLYIEDSLKNEIKDDQINLNTTLDKSSYYKNKNYLRKIESPKRFLPDTISADSLRADSLLSDTIKVVYFDLDSLFTSYDKDKQKRLLTQSISLARTTMNFVSNTNINVDNKVRRLRKYEIEKHRKFSLSLACLIFFFIGAPLGAIIRKGGLGMPVVVSVLFFLLYYIISLTGEKFVRESVITAFFGMWLSSFVIVPMSIFLSYKASTDSVIMNVETYFTFLKKFGNFLKNLVKESSGDKK
ncbi:MAG: LptF/LptG family permease [Bacteroidales bacterium]|nr:LptF/LptG family permease [Bacteroidales bacterium]MCF8391443.1 LptF/LptG family permease [Bacteroidales bacterium]